MPIEIFIGKTREATLEGRFVAFSKRINSVLVPESFLAWANQKYGQPDAGNFLFLWKDGAIPWAYHLHPLWPELQNETGSQNGKSPLSINRPTGCLLTKPWKNQKLPMDTPRIILEVVDNAFPCPSHAD